MTSQIPNFSKIELNYLKRYVEIVDDWDVFIDTLLCPLPNTLWIDTWRAPESAVCNHLNNNGFLLKPVSWRHSTYHYESGSLSAGNSFPYRAGLIHLQEAIALTTIDALDLPSLYKCAVMARRPFKMLDLCSAPGNKTVQAATLLRQIASPDAPYLIIANDIDYRRLRAVRGALDRLGHVNVAITEQDASDFCWHEKFDVVVADVPCGCEGTVRKNGDAIFRVATKDCEPMVQLQRKILHRALELVADDGSVVYSTCTLAPEENEGVIDAVLKECPEFELVEFETKAHHSPGLTMWKDPRKGGPGVSFGSSMARAKRYWPHQNDSGGFFTALIRRVG